MTSLVERYVAATNDGFPWSDQSEVERDVRSALGDIVDARMAAGLSREEAERVAVEELGDPVAFADQFRKQQRYLIGPRVFPKWWSVLRALLAILVPILVIVGVVESLADDSGKFISVFTGALFDGFNAIIYVTFWVTLTFAILEWKGLTSITLGATAPEHEWSANDLPDVATGRQIGYSDIITQVVVVALAAFALLRFRRDGSGAFGINEWFHIDGNLPVFNPDRSSLWIWAIVGLLVVSLITAIFGFTIGYWTRLATSISILENLLWIGVVVAMGSLGSIINPAIIDQIGRQSDFSITGANSTRIIMVVVVVISLIDIVHAIRGHLEYRRRVRGGSSPAMG